MLDFSASLCAAIARTHGVCSTAQLHADGVGANALRRSVAEGFILRVHNGVYRLATSPDTFESRCVAACLADPTAMVTGPAAARLWDWRHVPKCSEPIVAVGHFRKPYARGVIVRRSSDLLASDVVTRPDDIRVASPPRAWFDCARDLDDEHFEMLTELVIDRHCGVGTLWGTGRRLVRRGRPGSARVSRVMSTRSDWQRPADSGLEFRVLKALEPLTGELVRQHPIKLPTGIWIHPDGTDVEARWAVEIDHVTWHGGRLKAQIDKGRDRELRKIHWDVHRASDVELAEDFAGTIADLADLHARRRRELGLAPAAPGLRRFADRPR